MPVSSQDNRGDHNTNIASVAGNVYITNRRDVDAAVLAGLWAVILTVFGLVSQRDQQFFEATIILIVVLAVISFGIVWRGNNTRPALVFVFLGLLVALSPLFLPDPVEAEAVVEPIELPNVIGLDEEVARADLRELGLVVPASTVQDSTVPREQVVSQEPSGGTIVLPGSTVTLVVSTGPGVQTAEVPSLEGKEEQSAVDDLRALGLNANPVLQESEAPEGRVIGQVPSAGSTADPGSTVTIFISAGPPESPVTVPQLEGKEEQSAVDDLRALGLNANPILQESNSPEGRVVGQDPPQGSIVNPGATVTITVSLGPKEVLIDIPLTDGTLEAGARSALTTAGFTVTDRTVASATMSEGRVLRSDPPSGTAAKEGATVQLIVSSGVSSACGQLPPTPTIVVSDDPSLSTTEPDGSFSGFEPDLIETLLSQMCGRLPQYRAVTAAERFTSLAAGEVDIMMTGVVDRAFTEIDYTTPYVLIDGANGREGRALAVRGNASALRVALDAALVELIENGTWLRIHEDTLGTPDYKISGMLTFVIPDS